MAIRKFAKLNPIFSASLFCIFSIFSTEGIAAASDAPGDAQLEKVVIKMTASSGAVLYTDRAPPNNAGRIEKMRNSKSEKILAETAESRKIDATRLAAGASTPVAAATTFTTATTATTPASPMAPAARARLEESTLRAPSSAIATDSAPGNLVEWARQQEAAMAKQEGRVKETQATIAKVSCDQAKSNLASIGHGRTGRVNEKGEFELYNDTQLAEQKVINEKQASQSCN